jgi:hypothetical protein
VRGSVARAAGLPDRSTMRLRDGTGIAPRLVVWWVWPLLVVLDVRLGSASSVWAAWSASVCVLVADLGVWSVLVLR